MVRTLSVTVFPATLIALLWLRQGFVAHAETIWKDAIQALPEAPRFRHNLASLYQRNDRFAEALEQMEEESRRRPNPSPITFQP